MVPVELATWQQPRSAVARGRAGGADVLAAALQLGISSYDAHFVVVARDRGVPLVTGDKRLLAAWTKGAVSIEELAPEGKA